MLFAAQNGFLPFPGNRMQNVLGEHTSFHSQSRGLGGLGASPSFRDESLLALLEETFMTPSGQCDISTGDTELHRSFESMIVECRFAGQPATCAGNHHWIISQRDKGN